MPEGLSAEQTLDSKIDAIEVYRQRLLQHQLEVEKIWAEQDRYIESKLFRTIEYASQDDAALAQLKPHEIPDFLQQTVSFFVNYQENNTTFTRKELAVPDNVPIAECYPELEQLQTVADTYRERMSYVQEIAWKLCQKLSNNLTTFPLDHFEVEDIRQYLQILTAPSTKEKAAQALLGSILLENYTTEHPELKPQLLIDDRFYEFGDKAWKQQQIDQAVKHLFPQPTEADLLYQAEELPENPENRAYWRKRAEQSELPFRNILWKALTDTNDHYGEYLAQRLGEQIGPYMDDIGAAWSTYTPKRDRPEDEERARFNHIIMQHFKNMRALWREAGPRALETLHKDYGICHFGYYPEQLLLDQASFEPTDHPEKKYLSAIYQYDDHNGAGFSGKSALSKAYTELHPTHHLVVAEAKYRFTLLRRLHTIQSRYGGVDELPPDALIINAHGDSGLILFGPSNENRKYTTLQKQDFTEARPTPGIDHLLGEAPVVLVSCNTGAPEGIAAAAAKFFKRPVTAPTVATNIKDYGVQISPDGTATLQPTYYKNEQNTYVP